MTPPESDAERRRGLVAGFTAYLLWGFFPLYFAALEGVGALEVLASRIVWSFVFAVAALVALRTPWRWVRTAIAPERLVRLAAAAVLIAINWLTYIWCVTSGYVVEAALGYFINPLFNVAIGVWLFAEPLSRLGRTGVFLAFAGVAVIGWESWRTLWLSLLLTFSFGLYGVAKKKAHLPALQGLAFESAILTPIALAYLGWLALAGALVFGSTPGTTALLVLAGPATLLPLWLFAVAAQRIPYGVVGVLQYLAPTVQFLLGILVFGQQVVPSYWAGLALVWLGSAAYLASVLRDRRPVAPEPAP